MKGNGANMVNDYKSDRLEIREQIKKQKKTRGSHTLGDSDGCLQRKDQKGIFVSRKQDNAKGNDDNSKNRFNKKVRS